MARANNREKRGKAQGAAVDSRQAAGVASGRAHAVAGAGADELQQALMAGCDPHMPPDLTQLPHLTPAALLQCLQARYEEAAIYTATGSRVLIALNPFDTPVGHLYSPDVMMQYRGHGVGGDLPPHVYAVADAAYRQMMREQRSQSILVSGESGAGKTETAKLLMQYLAWVSVPSGGARVGSAASSYCVEQRVLQANPLLEAFGNAKTVHNDNSSRFGRFTEIQFNERGRISGAAIRTYLLERSRVVSVADPERNYHVFYQLCDGASDAERAALHLAPAREFRYLNRSSCYELAGVSNVAGYAATRRAMSIVGIPEPDQDAVFRTVAAVLHLGNVEFEATDHGEASAVAAPAEAALGHAANLLGVDAEGLRRALTTRTRATPDGAIVSPIDAAAAAHNRDSLAKTLYSRMFDWLVDKINSSIGQDPQAKNLIGVLDIYGFEQFQENDFEQLCINYANEKLQQVFNREVFKEEQAVYQREEIGWTAVEFEDNQDVLDLIEGRMGILDLLDEICRFPKASHEDLANKLYTASSISESKRFSKPKLSRSDFTLEHYAGAVTYRTEAFLDKNRDFVVAEHQALLGASSRDFVVALFPQEAEAPCANSAYRFNSVGSRFKLQLGELMAALSRMEPLFIRCIRPSASQHGVSSGKAPAYDPDLVLHQLRCGGVLEAVRVAQAGFPTRYLHTEFAQRYGMFASSLPEGASPLDVCKAVLALAGVEESQCRIGKTRLLFRAGALGALEERVLLCHRSALLVQSTWRMMRARRAYLQLRGAAIVLAAVWRGRQARAVAAQMRKERDAATLIQAHVRRLAARRCLLAAHAAALQLQVAWRRCLFERRVAAREEARALAEAEAALVAADAARAAAEAEAAHAQARAQAPGQEEAAANRTVELTAHEFGMSPVEARQVLALWQAHGEQFVAYLEGAALQGHGAAQESNGLQAETSAAMLAQAAEVVDLHLRVTELERELTAAQQEAALFRRAVASLGAVALDADEPVAAAHAQQLLADSQAAAGNKPGVGAGRLQYAVAADATSPPSRSGGRRSRRSSPHNSSAAAAGVGGSSAGSPDDDDTISFMSLSDSEGGELGSQLSGSSFSAVARTPATSTASHTDGSLALASLASDFAKKGSLLNDDCVFIGEVCAGTSVAPGMDPRAEFKKLLQRYRQWRSEFKRRAAVTQALLKQQARAAEAAVAAGGEATRPPTSLTARILARARGGGR